MHCFEIFFFLFVVVKIGTYYGHFSRIYLSIYNGHIRPPPAIITKLNYVKNGPIFKTTTQFFFNTVHYLITFSIVVTNKNRGAL